VNFLQYLGKVGNKAVDLLFPSRCVGCGKEGEFICFRCRRSLSLLLAPLCDKCGGPLTWEGHCLNCQRCRLVIDGIRSPFRFEGAVRQAIHQFKYNHLKALARPLAQLLEEYIQRRTLSAEVLVPVPLHPHRLRERGYNQGGELAKELGRLTGLPVVEGSLLRLRDTPSQVGATAELRYSNVAGAFACRDQRLRQRQVLLVDDVCTTGATLDACAVALKEAGVQVVWGITVAREV